MISHISSRRIWILIESLTMGVKNSHEYVRSTIIIKKSCGMVGAHWGCRVSLSR